MIASFIVMDICVFSLATSKAFIEPETKARNVWCQVLGDRQGCRDDNTRTCDNTVFCN